MKTPETANEGQGFSPEETTHGRNNRPARPTAGRRFTVYFLLTLVLSFVGTMAVWGTTLFFIVKEDGLLRPADYYESRIPEIAAFTKMYGPALLSETFRSQLEQVVPLQGMDYQVTDGAGRPLYGSWTEPVFSRSAEVAAKLNTTETVGPVVFTYIPVVDDTDGGLVGVLALAYELSLWSSNRDRVLPMALLGVVNTLAPFAFFFGFTLLFARRFSRRLAPDVSRLIDAAERIRRHDLDFSLDAPADTEELARLTGAFEKMRRALHESLQAQWRSEQAHRDMVAAVVHDVQTPLTVIQGLVDNLLSNEEKRLRRLDTYLPIIYRHTDRIARLVRHMERMTELERSDFVLHPEPLDVPAWLWDQCAHYKAICAEEGIRLSMTVKTADGHDGVLSLDGTRLEQVLANLVDNALRAMPDGGELRWEAAVEPGSFQLTVSDGGPGFTEKDLQHMFDRFYQGDESRSDLRGRAGLGLYIVKTIAEAHGGTVRARNVPGGGASVTVRIAEVSPTAAGAEASASYTSPSATAIPKAPPEIGSSTQN